MFKKLFVDPMCARTNNTAEVNNLVSNFMPHNNYPFLSRDSAYLLCETTNCYLNDKGFPPRCASSASVTLKNGKCQLYVQYLEKSSK